MTIMTIIFCDRHFADLTTIPKLPILADSIFQFTEQLFITEYYQLRCKDKVELMSFCKIVCSLGLSFSSREAQSSRTVKVF